MGLTPTALLEDDEEEREERGKRGNWGLSRGPTLSLRGKTISAFLLALPSGEDPEPGQAGAQEEDGARDEDGES